MIQELCCDDYVDNLSWDPLDVPQQEFTNYLLLLDDNDAGLDVGEGVHGGEDGLPLVLLAELAPRPSTLGERGGVHEAPQVEILLKIRHAVFHLVVVEERLHVSNLDIRLQRSDGSLFNSYTWLLR